MDLTTKGWRIRFTDRAEKQFGKLDKPVQKRIQLFLQERLKTNTDPRQVGHPLTGPLSHLWRYRVGDYRILCSIEEADLIILVIQVGHRREIYH